MSQPDEVVRGRCIFAQQAPEPENQGFVPSTMRSPVPVPGLPRRARSRHIVRMQGDRRYPATCNPNRARQPLTEEQQELATRNLSLARALAGRMRYAWPGAQDEFESAALLALVEAAQAFDPTRGVKFTTFCAPSNLGCPA